MKKKKNLLLIADPDQVHKKMLDIILDETEFKLLDCGSGKQAIQLCISLKPDLILLSLDLPDMHGIEVIEAIRQWSELPIIVLSAHTDNESVISSLNAGANDYVFKPFNRDVLNARINAALRSAAIHETGEPELINGLLRIDLVRHEVFLADELIPFTPKEYNLLRYFMTHRGKMLSHREILKAVWGEAHVDDTQYLRVFVGQIREKIEKNPSIPVRIITEAGIGYRMEVAEIVPLHEQGLLKLSA
ncbi:MAG: response regulator transcription factor [Alphaproteobacteria bacterium]|nr:response regulator transcription factor [Alphaproteobacteria bacterium]NCQ88915.1 response regulator transcription factor [Alphaproteobacteria bacterium]NCT07818.1 response regulator transcription factor [Alphaproteobacteria bacterium]